MSIRPEDFSEEQIRDILHLAAYGMKPVDLCKRYGISEIVFRFWQVKYGMPEIGAGGPRARALDEENARLKRVVGELTLEVRGLKQQIDELEEKLAKATGRTSASAGALEGAVPETPGDITSGLPRSILRKF